MRKFAIWIITASFLLSGCGNRENSAPSKGAKEPEIVMWLIGSEDQALTIRDISKEFYKATKIKVKCEAISWGDAHSKYLTSIAGGLVPDIGTMGLTWGTEFGSMGVMVDLRQAHPSEIAYIKNSVFPGLWDSIEYKGHIYGIPFDMTEYVMFYRRDIVNKPPETWQELAALLEELKNSERGMIFDWGSLSWIGFSPFLWQAGGDYFNPDYSLVTIDSPQAVTALNFFCDLYKKYNVPKTKIPLEQGMRTGDFPIAISGNWNIDSLHLEAPEINGKWSIAMLPKGPAGNRTAFTGGRIMGIFENSKKKTEAWQFIKFLFTPEIQSKLYEAALSKQDTYLPPSRRAWDILKMDAAFKDILVAQANDAKGPPPVASWDSCAKYVDEAIQKTVLKNSDPRTELAETKKRIEELLKR